jgi:hypothetical protein
VHPQEDHGQGLCIVIGFHKALTLQTKTA